jgi:hypothetical protein
VRNLPYGFGMIRSQKLPAEPVYWNWAPPTEAIWEWARTDHYFHKPVKDEEEVAFRVLVRWCRYRCGICGTSDERRRIVVDHDHRTNMARGLLCRECNCREGFGGGSVFGMYRERPPALVCDVKITWWSLLLPASPDLLQFQTDVLRAKRFRLIRDNVPWTAAETGIASRDDLTDAEVAEIVGRKESAVRSRRRSLTLAPVDIDAWL